MKIAKIGLVLALTMSTALAGCASNNGYGGGGGTGINKEIVGTVVGAGLGGWAGSTIGKKGSGQLAATAAGVFIGGLIGNQIGAYMDDPDKQMARALEYAALERYPDGQLFPLEESQQRTLRLSVPHAPTRTPASTAANTRRRS